MAEDSASYGWDGKRRRKLVLGLSATPEQRIDWLEQMMMLAHASGALPRRRDYVLPLVGTIEHQRGTGRIALAEASFVSTSQGELSFAGRWIEGEEEWCVRLVASKGEQLVGKMSAPRQPGDEGVHVSATRARAAPRAWEIRGTYMDGAGEPGTLTLRLSEAHCTPPSSASLIVTDR